MSSYLVTYLLVYFGGFVGTMIFLSEDRPDRGVFILKPDRAILLSLVWPLFWIGLTFIAIRQLLKWEK